VNADDAVALIAATAGIRQPSSDRSGIVSGPLRDRMRSAYVFLDVSGPLVAWMVYRAERVSAPKVHDRALRVFVTRRLSNKAGRDPVGPGSAGGTTAVLPASWGSRQTVAWGPASPLRIA
jgi:hypothetical protein